MSVETLAVDTLRAHVRQNKRLKLETTIVSTVVLETVLSLLDRMSLGRTLSDLSDASEVAAIEERREYEAADAGDCREGDHAD